MAIFTQTLHGTRASANTPVESVTRADFVFHGKSKAKPSVFAVSEETLSRGLLFMGGTGSGKTNTINMLVQQIKKLMTDKDVMLIFDAKGDYYKEFFNPEKDLLIGSSAQYGDFTAAWNVFNEITADGLDDETLKTNINEICRSIAKRYESMQQPFFPNAARTILSMFLLSMIRLSRTDDTIKSDYLYNDVINDYFQKAAIPQYNELADSFPDFNSLRLYIGDGANNQALGVLSELQIMVNETFFGRVFGGTGDFSIRRFIRSKGGRTLFVEYDLSKGEVSAPLYGLLIDLALKEALSRERSDGKVYIIIDEFALLPNLTHITDALNFGRGLGLHIAAGLQSIAQLYHVYGKDKALSIAAGFGSLFAFRPNDCLTAEYERNFFGENYLSETTVVSGTPLTQRRNGYTAEDWELRNLNRGEAFIGLVDELPFVFKFDRYKAGN